MMKRPFVQVVSCVVDVNSKDDKFSIVVLLGGILSFSMNLGE